MYQVPASRVHPICIVFLLDQSQSMSEPISGSTTPKAIVLAEVVNNALYELILRTVKDPREGPRHYYDIGLIGYSDEAHHLFSGPLAGRSLVSNSELAKSPVRVDTVDAGGGRMAKKPVFVEPVSKGWTKMCEALDLCGGLVNQWLQQPGHQNSFPPIVVNVSDGEATDGDPTEWSRRLRSLGTTDGNLLFFNVSLSSEAVAPLFFPTPGTPLPDNYSAQLFAMSSELPAFMADAAARQGLHVSPGARGFVCNADIKALVTALQIGTAPTPGGVR